MEKGSVKSVPSVFQPSGDSDSVLVRANQAQVLGSVMPEMGAKYRA